MNLVLEIEDGHTYNNLVHEIESLYDDYLLKANQFIKLKDYEKTCQYYLKCIQLDPDNSYNIDVIKKLHIYIDYHIINLFNKLNEYKHKQHVYNYYLIKIYCIYLYFKTYINRKYNNRLYFIQKAIFKLNEGKYNAGFIDI
jgi:hypothetical protein